MWQYVCGGQRAPGLPPRDLTAAAFGALPAGMRRAVEDSPLCKRRANRRDNSQEKGADA